MKCQIVVVDNSWLKNMNLSAKLYRLPVKLAWHTYFRLRLGLAIIHLGCRVMGISFTFEEPVYDVIE